MTPEKLLKTAHKKGISVVAITDHNTLKGSEIAQKLAPQYNITVIPAVEIDTADHCQILAYGISEPIVPYRKTEIIINEIHKQGGVAILPHPFDFIYRVRNLKKIIQLADGMEVTNMGTFGNRKARKFAKKYGVKVQTVGADAHVWTLLDSALMGFSDNCNSVNDYLYALKNGLFTTRVKKAHPKAMAIAAVNLAFTQVYGFFIGARTRLKVDISEG